MNREDRRRLQRAARQVAGSVNVMDHPLNTVACRTDALSVGAVVVGTAAGDTYPSPRTVLARTYAAEHSRRMRAYRVVWDNAPSQVYYGDCVVWVRASA